MAERSLSVPVRSALSKWFPIIIVGLLAVSAVSGFVAYTAHSQQETITEQQTTGTWSVESTFTHGATVQRDSSVFTAGERLANRRLYFTGITPELDGQYNLTHDSSDGDPALATIELSLIIQAVEEIDGEEVVYWEETEQLATKEGELSDEDSLSADFELNVSAVDEQIEEVENDLGASPGTTEVLVRADATIEGSTAGEVFTDTRTGTLSISVGGQTYSINTDSTDRTSYETTETITTAVEPSLLEAYGSIVMSTSTIVLMSLLLVGRRQGMFNISDSERARYEFETDKSDFSEWITPGEVRDDNYKQIRLPTLRAAVDVAIDGNRRVLETPAGTYVVLLENKKYVYEPDSEPTSVTPDQAGPESLTGEEATADYLDEPSDAAESDANDDT